jgi:ribose-phosphate pyrophosphokinase
VRIYTRAGDLAFKTFVFPDGQPHFALETYDREFSSVTVEAPIRSAVELLTVLLASDVLRQHGYSEVSLDIRYLLGARMDRAIDSLQPFSLQTIARLINGAGFSRVRVLDVHSDVATRLIRNSSNILPVNLATRVWEVLGRPSIVVPDKGAIRRVVDLTPHKGNHVFCEKERDMATGRLSNFRVGAGHSFIEGKHCLIMDDICDGGRTFTGIAKLLRSRGAEGVSLYVTHGIFSQPLPLEGIDRIFTTDSYTEGGRLFGTTVTPISMKELA